MAEIQSLDEPDWIKTRKHLVEHFHNHLFSKHDETQEICLIFDRQCAIVTEMFHTTQMASIGRPLLILH